MLQPSLSMHPSQLATTPTWQPRERAAFPATRPSATADLPPRQIEFKELVRLCRSENERYLQGALHDAYFTHELFRRALVERDDAAWEYVYTSYAMLVRNWIQRTSAFAHSDESSEWLVSAAFTRFWQAVTPERFAAFPTSAALLNYLHRCARCAVIDHTRAQQRIELLPQEAPHHTYLPQQISEDAAMNYLHRQELWRYIDRCLHSEVERIVIFSSFVMGRKPRDIYQHHQDLFTSVSDVYRIKRNVLERLKRDPDLRQMLE